MVQQFLDTESDENSELGDYNQRYGSGMMENLGTVN
jgi:hypothetical protein